MTPTATLVLRLPPKAEFCAVARKRILAFAHGRGIALGLSQAVVAAVGEALANAIEHAGTTQPIEIEVDADAERLVVTVRDAGVGFETSINAITLPDNGSERGRGLAIMRDSSDIFTVTALPGGGTEVTVGRYLSDDKRERRLSA
jgi:anti-sigma regulatory factor (Ser/Thr protein kinase)